MPTFPKPEYYHEVLSGVLLPLDQPAAPVPDLPSARAASGPTSKSPKVGTARIWSPLALTIGGDGTGAVVVRFALQTATPPTRYVIPGLFVGERGGAVTGLRAWRYMQDRWIHHPRADVVGVDPDGKAVQFFLKELDFGTRVHVFAFAAPDSFTAIGEVLRVEAEPGAVLPELLTAHRPG